MKHNSSKGSRKASQVRGERVSKPNQSHEVIKLGVDTHSQQYTFARMVDHQGIQPAQKLSPAVFIEFLKKQLTLAKRVVMVYEAGPYGFALHREATALGVECLVCAPERLSRGRKRVNDKIDATELLSRLDRHLAGNTTALRLVRVPTVAQEIHRRLGASATPTERNGSAGSPVDEACCTASASIARENGGSRWRVSRC